MSTSSAATTIVRPLPPGQQWAAPQRWPTVGERLPRASDAPWQVSIEGEVKRPLVLSLTELKALPQSELVTDIHCVTRWSKPDVQFRGVKLADLLASTEPADEAKFVSFVALSERNHSTSLPLDDVLALGTLLALEVAGEPLDTARGGPVRIVVPGRYFYKSLKWLERIELLREDRLGYWESAAGYHNEADPWREQRYLAPGISAAAARAILDSRDLTGRDLRGLSAEGRDLSQLNAAGALLRDANFRHCKLQGAKFDGANLSNAHLQQADLRQASFRGADLEGADFSGADLRGACLLGASLLGATFVDQSANCQLAAQMDRSTELDPAAIDDLTPDQQEYVRRLLS